MADQNLLISSRISIIITTFNEEDYIIRCLQSIEKTGIKKVIIEDANSSDNTVQLIKDFESDLEINLFTNNFQKPPYDSIHDLIKRVETEWFYLIGADDILGPNSFQEFVGLQKTKANYHIPLMNFWSETQNLSLGIYPENDWLKQLNNATTKTDIVKTCIDYGTLDVLVLAVSKKSTSLWAYKQLKEKCKEGILFWIILVSILLEKEKPLVSATREVSLTKIFDQIKPSGNEHPLNSRVLENSLSYSIKCTFNSIYNILKVSFKFKLPIQSIWILLFKDRGIKVKVRPLCKAPLSTKKIIQILKKFIES